MNPKNKIIWGLIVLVAVVLVVMYGGRNNGGSQGGVIKIGFIGPLTGDAAVYGEPFQKTVQLAVAEINSAGGINGKQLQVIYEDDGCSGKGGANATQKLINTDGVRVILGSFCSSGSLAAVPVAAQSKVWLFSPGSSSPELTGVSRYFSRDYPSDASQGKTLADVSYQKNNWHKVAFIQEQLDYPLGIYNAFVNEFSQFGGKTTKEEFPTNTTDFRSLLAKLRATGPDALFINTQTPAAADRILKQLVESGWKAKIVINDAIAGDADTVKADAAILEGAYTAEFIPDMSNEKFKALVTAYKAKYNKDMLYANYMSAVYDAVYLLKEGISSVGYDGEKLADWSRTISNWQGASGSVTIGENGDRVGGHVPEVIHNGKTQPLQ